MGRARDAHPMLRIETIGGTIECVADLSADTVLWAAREIDSVMDAGEGTTEMITRIIGEKAFDRIIESGIDMDGLERLYAELTAQVKVRRRVDVGEIAEGYLHEVEGTV